MDTVSEIDAQMMLLVGIKRRLDLRSDRDLERQMESCVAFLDDVVGNDVMCMLTEPFSFDAVLSAVLYACLMHPASARLAGLYLYASLTSAHVQAWAGEQTH